jgi:SAM-dependent methyltransferase
MKRVDLFESTYSHFTEQVLDAVRKETFGTDIGQNSWVTVDEYDGFIRDLRLTSESHVLEVASGSGGPALYMAQQVGCRVTGIDANESGVKTATEAAVRIKKSEHVNFVLADATAPLKYSDSTFDAILCIDSMNHFENRLSVLKEWRRVLKPGHQAVFTDPVVITGPVTNDELARRSLVGLFLFVPPGINEQLIDAAGLKVLKQTDVTNTAALVSGRWHQARERHKEALLKIEGEERFKGLQEFFATVHSLTTERRLSRVSYLVEKPPN